MDLFNKTVELQNSGIYFSVILTFKCLQVLAEVFF